MKKIFNSLLVVIFALASINVNAQYTLQDEDIIVENGIIMECSYDFSQTDIIIPENLDGQTIIGIADVQSDDTDGVFSDALITSVKFPSSIEFIGTGAFRHSELIVTDFSLCSNLLWIGIEAFSYSKLETLDLTACSNLETILYEAFYSNNIDGIVDLSNCTNLKYIGSEAFSHNEVDNFNLSNLSNLKQINEAAFSENEITTIDLSDLTSLTFLDYDAFDNDDLSTVYLPTNTEFSELGWKDEYGNLYSGGDIIPDFQSLYYVPAEYTLTDDDVVVENGVIISCSYSFDLKNIIIPQILDGQSLIGISDMPYDKGIFEAKKIREITIPNTLEFVGNSAFKGNEIQQLDLSNFINLEKIGSSAFKNNYISELNIAGCYNLKYIYNSAFSNLAIEDFHLDFTDSPLLEYIGEYAFTGGSIISVDFSQNANLKMIMDNAFNNHAFSSIDLSACTSLIYIGDNAFSTYLSTAATSFNLPVNSENPTIEWIDENDNTYSGGTEVSNFLTYYKLNMPYTISDSDVTIENGVITNVNIGVFTEIIIPEILQGQTVVGLGEYLFYNEDISSISLPSSVETIYSAAFYRCENLVDIEFNAGLKRIEALAFKETAIETIEFPSSIQYIGRNSFSYAEIDTIDLSFCNNLVFIGFRAFGNNNFEAFVLPENTNYSSYGWRNNNEQLSAGDTITNLSYYYYIPFPYEIADNEVVVEDGFIMSCSYDYTFKSIVIPEVLQSQTIIGIYNSVFAQQEIYEMHLPTSLQYINDSAFCQVPSTINIDECINLIRLGDYALYSLSESDLSLNDLSYLQEIGSYALYMNTLSNFDMSGCSNLVLLGKEFISPYNIYENDITFPTPAIEGYQFNYWEDSTANTFNGGDIITDFFKSYSANLTQVEFTIEFNIMCGGEPIEDAIVSFEGDSFISDSNGEVLLENIVSGTYNYTISLEGYISETGQVIVSNQNVIVDIVMISTEIDEHKIESVNFYPNPANDYVIVDLKESGIIEIIDLNKRVLISEYVSRTNAKINIANLSPGTYFIKTGNNVNKLIKQ